MTDIRSRILECMGEVSMCWEHVDQAGVFDSTRAVALSEELYQFVMSKITEKSI